MPTNYSKIKDPKKREALKKKHRKQEAISQAHMNRQVKFAFVDPQKDRKKRSVKLGKRTSKRGGSGGN